MSSAQRHGIIHLVPIGASWLVQSLRHRPGRAQDASTWNAVCARRLAYVGGPCRFPSKDHVEEKEYSESIHLVRKVLAAAVDPGMGEVRGQPVIALVCDANNPACTPGGRIDEQYRAVKGALSRPAILKRTTWQAIVGVLAAKGGYEKLMVRLEEKYGITVD